MSRIAIFRQRGVRIAGVAVCATLILWLGASWFCVYQLTRRANPPFAEPPPTIGWGQVESLRLTTIDGLELGAWYVPGPDVGPSVVLLHGNGDCRSKALPLAQFFAGQKCSVLLVSLRAHGDSSGEVNDIGYSARHDVVAAVSFLEGRRPGRRIIIQGRSLGAAAAVFAAETLGERVQGYILESPYADLRTAVRNRVENRLPFPFGRIAYAGLALTGRWVLPDIDKMAPVDAVTAIPADIPILLIAGGLDRNARPEEAIAIQERVHSHCRLVWFEEAAHESFYARDPARYSDAVTSLIVTPKKDGRVTDLATFLKQ